MKNEWNSLNMYTCIFLLPQNNLKLCMIVDCYYDFDFENGGFTTIFKKIQFFYKCENIFKLATL